MPAMHLFVHGKLKSIGYRVHSDKDSNDPRAKTFGLSTLITLEWENKMEVRVIATLQAKPEFVSAVSDAVHEIIDPSRQELGNLQYDLHRDLEKPGTFVFFERWASAEALEKHNATEHFKQFVASIDGKLDLLDIKQLKKIA